MATNLVQNGATVNYTNGGTAISSGDVVVVGQQVGVALEDIANGATGAVAMEGVFSVPKVSGADIGQGEAVIWDSDPGGFEDSAHTPAAGDVSGCCVAWEAAGVGVTTIAVKLNVGIGTVA